MASPQDYYERHRQHLLDGDADGIADLYTDDAVMLSFEFDAKEGRAAIRDQFAEFFRFHGAIGSVETDRQVARGDDLFVEFTMESERGQFQLVNAFTLRDGKAERHFSNVVRGEVAADEAEQ
ncbi:MAG: nuclear transport factor 2 family protein [Rhodothermales bacterium]|nr:nuclear transport factor 2 family protein [Rhodothermales bacterium]